MLKKAIQEKKQHLIQQYGAGAQNTGQTEVQVALLTERIQGLNQHFSAFPKDHASRRGLLRLVGQRKRLLTYLRESDAGRYRQLIQALGLRK